MTTEKAIKEIEYMIELEWRRRFPADLAPDYIEAFEMAIEALQKQAPVKPKAAWTNKCHFCPNCGEKLDWED